jgi:hypothetical protein
MGKVAQQGWGCMWNVKNKKSTSAASLPGNPEMLLRTKSFCGIIGRELVASLLSTKHRKLLIYDAGGEGSSRMSEGEEGVREQLLARCSQFSWLCGRDWWEHWVRLCSYTCTYTWMKISRKPKNKKYLGG